MSRDERNIRSNFQVCGSTVNVQCVFSRLRWCKLSPYHLLNRTTLVFMVADSVTTPVVFRVPPWVCLLELNLWCICFVVLDKHQQCGGRVLL